MRLLLVEDDANLSNALKVDLENAGFVVDTAMDGKTGELLGSTENYAIAVLDLGLPNISGLEVLAQWRAKNNLLPVIVLTARDAWHEKVDGFKAGADDYLGKPFHFEELLMRIQAVLKRLHGQRQSQIKNGDIILDEEHQSAILKDNQRVELTAIEFRLLRYFMLNPGIILPRQRIADHIYQYDNEKDSNIIEVYINRLRQKLGKNVITTRRGQGYVLGDD